MYISPMTIPLAALAIPIVAIICGTILKLCGRDGPQESNPDDIKLIQELHQGLSKMEQRIEALETIMYDQHRKDR